MHATIQVRPGRPGRSTHRTARWSLVFAGILALGLAPIVSAAPPVPSAGSVTVDGDTSDWSLAADQFADLTHGGVAGRPVVGHLYLRYDCDTETLFGLVLLTGDNRALVSRPENAYLRIGTTGKLVSGESGNNGTPPDFSWVDSDGALALGYEVSAPLAPGSYTIRSHVLIPDDSSDGYASIDNISRATPLEIDCTEPTPTPTPRRRRPSNRPRRRRPRPRRRRRSSRPRPRTRRPPRRRRRPRRDRSPRRRPRTRRPLPPRNRPDRSRRPRRRTRPGRRPRPGRSPRRRRRS